ncbi:uncharacterized protein MONBRDRAFT_24730 [Monosiga brevicollis MX1]|uniref:Phytanoyl-CoA dioxygenase family protein n=1 Tax=Monosiga brevicollis TaxID=81824 RepID=A9UXA9_MONBE|nr:uncharacterized protein MONBRDRAFT_24730 [Monosiga brevicollis MX1]EDQ90186.1 predicted protein [Monosiga brevicollis MX1]|eukprot:XP_001744953.1 hypothetical protein [Monosiga brevicollis MX1]
MACTCRRLQVPTLFHSELHLLQLFDLFCGRDLLEMMLAITGADELRLLPSYTIRPKMPHLESHNLPWHQDGGLDEHGQPQTRDIADLLEAFGLHDGYFRTINCWAPLVQANKAAGCLRFIPQSHRQGLLSHLELSQTANGGPKHPTQVEPGIMAELEPHAVDIETSPGDLVLFSNLLVYSDQLNERQGYVRWSAEWRYQDAEQVAATEPGLGHIVRSLIDIDNEIQSPQEWALASA